MNDPIATHKPSVYGGDADDEVHIEAWLIGLYLALLWFLVSKIHKHIIAKYTHGAGADDEDDTTDISDSVREVEKLLEYSFKNKRLLEEALTHSSCSELASYQRLEWLGDSALGLAVSNFLFSVYPDFQPGPLSLLRSANTCNEKLARVAVRRRLHWFLKHNATALDGKMREFALAVQEEDDTVVHGGEVKAPKVLADIVESVAGAVYVDCKLDLRVFWAIFRRLLEPIVDPEILRKQPHPVSFLIDLCKKDGRKVDFKYREEDKDVEVYVDEELIASAYSENKNNAKLQAAKAALEKLCLYECSSERDVDYSCMYGTTEIEGAMDKLYALCGKKRWPQPYYGIVKKSGPSHERRYVYSVEIKSVKNVSYDSKITRIEGDEKSSIGDAKNSAASLMIWRLRELKYIN